MSTNQPTRRRSGDTARSQALDAARELLLAAGPSAVTLKAVGEKMGVGHANLIHHFGSAAGLQGALMDRMVRDLADQVTAGLATLQPQDWGSGALLDVVFDAFAAGGASQLAAWMALAREMDRADSFAQVVRDLADRVADVGGGGTEAREKARAIVLTATYMAFADGLIGGTLKPMLDAPAALARDLAVDSLAGIIAGDPAIRR
ncbi:TetR/AcrR family transcriptional regulator [Brevundimonas sp.]|uniref:TetR/AcrR family transcriptional regulator n=1 Tax=Brevundimonas sp. TaxID=1871086 RepID=UPI003D0BE8A7